MAPTLYNIAKVAVAETSQLSTVTHIPGRGVLLNRSHDWRELTTVDLSTYTITSSTDDGCTIYTHTVSAFLTETFDGNSRHYAFLLTTIGGQKFLVGSYVRPYPVVSTTITMPGSPTEKSGCQLSLTYKSQFPCLPVLD